MNNVVRVTFPDGTSEIVQGVGSYGTDNHGVLTLYVKGPYSTDATDIVRRYVLANVRSWETA